MSLITVNTYDHALLQKVLENQEKMSVQQDKLNTDVAAIKASDATTKTALAGIQAALTTQTANIADLKAEVIKLQNENVAIDFSGLDEAVSEVSDVNATAVNIAANVTQPPPPPPPPTLP